LGLVAALMRGKVRALRYSCQPKKNRALMRDRQLQTEPPEKEQLSFADNKSASIHLPKMVPIKKIMR
jgi:hypothetical protein